MLSNVKVGVVNGCPAGGSAVSRKAGWELDSCGWISALTRTGALGGGWGLIRLLQADSLEVIWLAYPAAPPSPQVSVPKR